MSVRTLVKSIQDIMRKDSGVDGDAQRISQLCWLFFLKIIDDQDQELEMMRDGYQSPVPERCQWRNWAADPEGLTGEALLTFVNEDLFPAMKGLKPTGQPGDRRRVVRDVFEDAYNYMKSGQLLRQVVNKINGIDFNNLSERQHFGDVYEQLLNDLQSAGNAGEYYTPRAVTAFMVDRIDPKPGEIIFDPSCGTGGFLTCAMKHMRDRYVKRPEDEALMQQSLRAVEKKPLPHMLCVTNMLLHGVEDPSFVRHDNTLARPYISWEQKDRVDVILTNPPFGGKEEDGIEGNFPQHFRTRETADLFLALFIRLLRNGGVAAIVLPDGSLFGEGVKTRLKEALLEECNLHTIVRLPSSVFKPYASIGTNLLFFEKGEPTKDIWFYEHQVPDGQKAYSMTKPIRVEHFASCVEWWGGPDRKNREEGAQAWKVSIDDVKARGYNLDFKNPHIEDANHGDPAELLEKLDQAEAKATQLRSQLRAIFAEAMAHSTEASLLLDHYGRVVGAKDAVPRLRRFVLDLAVRGKLVEQSSEQGHINSQDGPFAIPSNWCWRRIGDELDLLNGMAFKPTDWVPSGLPIVRIQNLNNPLAPFNFCDPAKARDRSLIDNGAFLISWSGTPGTSFGAFIWQRGPAVLNQHIFRCDFKTKNFDSDFLRLAINGRLDEMIAKAHGGVGLQHITKGKLEAMLIALPPLAEQRRIVARVDELMALCDLLEASITIGEQTRSRLLEAVLHHSLEPA